MQEAAPHGPRGKYLNRYPFGRLPFVPAGGTGSWRSRTRPGRPVYRLLPCRRPGVARLRPSLRDRLARGPSDRFVRSAPASQPFFLLFAPSAPHAPWIPAARHQGTVAGLAIEASSEVDAARRPAVGAALPARAARSAPPGSRSSGVRTRPFSPSTRRSTRSFRARRPPGRHGDLRALGQRLLLRGASVGGQETPYEACVRVPLAVHASRPVPGTAGGARLDGGPGSDDPGSGRRRAPTTIRNASRGRSGRERSEPRTGVPGVGGRRAIPAGSPSAPPTSS